MNLITKTIRAGKKVTIRALAEPAKSPNKKDPCETLKFCSILKKKDPDELDKLVSLWDLTAKCQFAVKVYHQFAA